MFVAVVSSSCSSVLFGLFSVWSCDAQAVDQSVTRMRSLALPAQLTEAGQQQQQQQQPGDDGSRLWK